MDDLRNSSLGAATWITANRTKVSLHAPGYANLSCHLGHLIFTLAFHIVGPELQDLVALALESGSGG